MTLDSLKIEPSQLLMIFVRNARVDTCKTRLAEEIGSDAALEIYRILLRHTARITRTLPVHKRVYYSEDLDQEDEWNPQIYSKELQRGADLGERMRAAFHSAFQEGFKKIIIIGSDMLDLETKDLEAAFEALEEAEAVVGPATDGGYYLLGLKKPETAVFRNKQWGTSTVLEDTLMDMEGKKVALLPQRNDIDVYEDLKGIEIFRPYLKS